MNLKKLTAVGSGRHAIRHLFPPFMGCAAEASAAPRGWPWPVTVVAAAETDADWHWWIVIGFLLGAAAALLAARAYRKKLREAKQRIASLLERADCILWEARVWKTGQELHWNVKTEPSGLFERLFPPAKYPDRNSIWKSVNPEDREAMDARSRAALEMGAPGYEQEVRVNHPSGELWLHERVVISSAGRNRWNLVGIVTDTTERRRTREKLQQAQRQIVNMVANADCMLWSADVVRRDDQIQWLQFNEPTAGLYSRLFGDFRPGIDGRLWSTIDVPDLQEMNARSRAAILSGKKGYEQEFCARNKTGTYWLRESVTIAPVEHNRFHLVGVLVDVSAKHAAEEALAAEKERLDVTLSAVADGLIATDVDGLVRYVNRAAIALTEWDIADAINQPASAVLALRGEDSAQPLELPIKAVVEDDSPAPLPERAVLHGRHDRSGLIEGTCAPLHHTGGSVTGTVIVFRDITQREMLGREMQRTSKLESVGLLAGGIAHDFNNILTVIAGNLSVALLDNVPADDVRRGLKEAEQAAIRARDLTQQLLTFAKGGDPIRSAVRLPELLTEVTRFALRGSNSKAEFALPADLWPAEVDRGQITQVVQNIVINASQAMPAGGSIRVAARNVRHDDPEIAELEKRDYVCISIQDHGPGIAVEDHTRIFDPYFTTKEHGAGLGLATVHSIVAKHHGRVQLESRPGAGATFHIWMPATPHAKLVAQDGSVENVRLQGRVLFMDDEPAICRMAAGILRRLGLTVELANDGATAIAAYEQSKHEGRPFDLVIVDLTVPGGMGGREAIDRIRTLDPHVRAIVSSGYSSDPVLANFADYGFIDRISKPYRLLDFISVVRKTLENTPNR